MDERVGVAVHAKPTLLLETLRQLARYTNASVVLLPDGPDESTADALRSQGKHTPFSGYELPGRVRCTIAAGQVAYESWDRPEGR